MREKKILKLTYIVLLVIGCYALLFNKYWRFWDNKTTPFISDNAISYWYVPATFIHHDYKVYHERNNFVFPDSEGRLIPKYTYGMSIMYAPLFFIGHKLAEINGEKLDGYSSAYGTAIQYGCIIYGLAGLFFLSRVLLRYYSDRITALTILLIFFGSNLMIYISKESERVHCSLFFLISVFIWYTIRWHEKPVFSKSFVIGLLIGLITMIRPTDILILILFVFYGCNGTLSSLKNKLQYFIKHKYFLVVSLLGFVIAILPQILFWKSYSGEWIHYGYGEERFFWTAPKLIKMLFSYRNGWLLYSPIMVFSLYGLFISRKYCPNFFSSNIIYVLLNLYLLSCWWCWWYMGFGLRALIQGYPVMAIGLASFITWISEIPSVKGFTVKITLGCLFSFFVFLNFVQSIQYRNCLLSSDGMSKKMYWKSFCKITWTDEEINEARRNFPRIDIPAAVSGKR
jgi:hypothetical protein